MWVEMNRGSAALAEMLENELQVTLARKIGISQSHLSRLAGGAKPKMLEDALLLAAHGIPVEWWDQPADSKRGQKRRKPSAA